MTKNLKLLENEEILLKTKVINRFIKADIGFMIFFLIFISFITVYLTLISSFWIVFLFIWPIIFLSILLQFFIRELRSIYLITNARVVKIRGKGLIRRNRPIHEIYLDDIAFIQVDRCINVVSKGPSGELHYYGRELKAIYFRPNWSKNYGISAISNYKKLKYNPVSFPYQFRQKKQYYYIKVKVKIIEFQVDRLKDLELRKKIIDLLIDLIPLKKHLYLENVYLITL